ncbi:MAG TPA: response regulator [Elusimicrobiales bacterium]|nr:response regulator [Elusimicrobiales bacterium]
MARILIVDDEPDIRLAIRTALRLRGHEVTEAQDGPAALAALEGERPGLVLLDIRLPGMDGLEVLGRIRGISRSLPVVMMTGCGHIHSAAGAAELGADGYLQKPFGAPELAETVARFISGKQAAPSAGESPRPAAGDRRGLAFFAASLLLALSAVLLLLFL